MSEIELQPPTRRKLDFYDLLGFALAATAIFVFGLSLSADYAPIVGAFAAG